MNSGLQPLQELHRRARDALRGAIKHGRKRQDDWTVLDRWNKDNYFRQVQSEQHGWTIEKVKCLDDVARIEMSYTATKFQRNKSDCCVKVLCNDS